MRLKLVLVLLCLVAFALAGSYRPNKSAGDKKEAAKKESSNDDVEDKSIEEVLKDAGGDDEDEDIEEEVEEKETLKKKKQSKDKKKESSKKSGKDGKAKKSSKKAKDDDITESVKGEDVDDDMEEYQACNRETAGDDELCHCDQDEIDCSETVMDTDDPHLRTMDLVIKKKDFKPVVANFSTNGINRLLRNRILPGYEKYVSVLDISHNEVRFADSDVFKPFTNLSKLDLSYNNLQTFKKPVFEAVGSTLHRLDLGYNKIKTLPDNIFDGMSSLKKLILDGNPIKEWKKEMFKGLDNLETLSLDNCKIEDLPADIFEFLPKLIGLSIRGNPMDEIPAVVTNLKSLKDIDMSETKLTEIRYQAFAGDSDLEEIILEKMKFLSVVRDCGFCGLPKLKTLLLNDNAGLFELHPNAFGFIKAEPGHKTAAITELDLHNSNISTISEHMMDYDKLDTFKVGENPWNCDCDTMFMMNERFTFKQDSVSPKCSYPEELKDKHLGTIRAADACEDARFLGRSGRFSSVLGLGLLVAFIAIGAFYLQSSGKLSRFVRTVRKEPEVSYTNLQSNAEDFSLESDFQPRPAEV